MSLSGWSSDKKITLTIPDQAAELVDFPVLINLDTASGITDFDCSAVFTELGANSKRIAIEIGNTGVQTYIEIERWDDVNNSAQIWAKVPSVSATESTTLNFYYDNAQPDNTAYVGNTGDTPAQVVWDDNFIAVYHMSQDPSAGGACILDSTSNANHGTPTGMTSGNLVDGLIGKTLDFNGAEYITVPNDASMNSSTLTVEQVLKFDVNADTNQIFVSKKDSTWNQASGYYISRSPNVTTIQGVGGGASAAQIPVGATDDGFYSYASIYSGTTYSVYKGGVSQGSGAVGALVDNTNNLVFGRIGYGIEPIFAQMGEVRLSNVVRSSAWLVATNLSNSDELFTFSLPQTGTVQVEAALDQLYNLSLDPILAALGQEYSLTSATVNALEQIWAHILEQSLTQHYGNADTILSSLGQLYGNASPVVQALVQKYDDMVAISNSLIQQYNLLFKAETSLDQRWAVCSDQVVAELVQEWDVRNRAEVMAALGQYWGLFRDGREIQVPLFYVMADGVLLNPPEFSWRLSGSSAVNECTVPLVDQAVWNSIQRKGHMEIHWNGITYEFFIEEKTRSRTVSESEYRVDYVLKGLSRTAGLEAPYALPVTKSWSETVMASAIVAELAEGYEIDWQIDDFPVLPGAFNVNNLTPLSAIRALVGSSSVEAVVQTSPDGKLIIRREFPVSPTRWHEVVADHTIYDDGDVFSDADDRDVMPGYNYVEISDEDEQGATKRLEHEDISDTEKRVRGYSVPWEDDFPLDTSGGEWVSIADNGAMTEEIEAELVEFVDGVASLSKPFYDVDLQGNSYPLQVEWLRDDLGEITASEDGSLVAAVAGNSLARISYLTKYREWTVRDTEIESVQVFIPGDEVTV